jgi:aspartyl-tRNA(Asn)/glutamyl-tRNA(Gln) amidotransferase subunit A
VARDRTLPPLLLDFEVVGPIARTVADLRMLFDVVRGPSAADRRSWAAHALREDRSMRDRLRVLYVATLDAAPVDPAIRASCEAAARTLRELGHDVVEASLPLDLGFMTDSWPIIGQMGLSWMFSRQPSWRDGASARYLEMAAQGDALPAARLWDVLETVEQLRRDCASLFGNVDLIMTPATAALPWPAEEPYPKVIDGQPVGPRGHAVFTGWVNAAGLPALALPSAPAPGGLPTGFQLIGPYGADRLLLDIGERYEAVAPWAHRWPAL